MFLALSPFKYAIKKNYLIRIFRSFPSGMCRFSVPLTLWTTRARPDGGGASPWGCPHQPTLPAARRSRLSARPGSASARRRLWRRIRLLAGGRRSRCVRSGSPTSPPRVDWLDRSLEHWRRDGRSFQVNLKMNHCKVSLGVKPRD